MSAPPIKRCPKCGKKVRRLIGAGIGIIFKGSGFYATDYRKDTKKQENHKKEEKASKSCSTCTPAPSGCSSCK